MEIMKLSQGALQAAEGRAARCKRQANFKPEIAETR